MGSGFVELRFNSLRSSFNFWCHNWQSGRGTRIMKTVVRVGEFLRRQIRHHIKAVDGMGWFERCEGRADSEEEGLRFICVVAVLNAACPKGRWSNTQPMRVMKHLKSRPTGLGSLNNFRRPQPSNFVSLSLQRIYRYPQWVYGLAVSWSVPKVLGSTYVNANRYSSVYAFISKSCAFS